MASKDESLVGITGYPTKVVFAAIAEGVLFELNLRFFEILFNTFVRRKGRIN